MELNRNTHIANRSRRSTLSLRQHTPPIPLILYRSLLQLILLNDNDRAGLAIPTSVKHSFPQHPSQYLACLLNWMNFEVKCIYINLLTQATMHLGLLPYFILPPLSLILIQAMILLSLLFYNFRSCLCWLTFYLSSPTDLTPSSPYYVNK